MKHLLSIIFLFLGLQTHAQELPPIEKFSSADYNGDNQNWMISQAENEFIYVANNKGLLEYNGSVWTSYVSPNNSVMRAVNVIDDKIYTGCYEEFGYWQKNKLGRLDYMSLLPKLKDKEFKDDQIWNILDYDEWILFQSGHELYFYHKVDETFKIISSESIIYKVFLVGNQLYYHVANEGIFSIKDGNPTLVINDAVVLEDRVINIFERENKLLLLTRNSGFYYLENDTLKSWEVSSNSELKTLNVFNSIQLDDGSLILGTISNGILKISTTGAIDYSINQKKGLANNTVLSLFEDKTHNVWAGLDNGINCINVKSPIRTFIDYEGVLGTVYSTIIFKNQLYVGTNQGLFYRSLDDKNQAFQFVEGTAGQVWSLYSDGENLMCGHHLGTFLIDNNTAEKISTILGAWNFKKIPNHQNLLLQGNYSGLYILEKKDSLWSLKHKVEGFGNSARFFEINDDNEIFVNHEYKGLYSMQIDNFYRKVDSVKLHPEVPTSKSSSLISYRNAILYAANEGIFRYEKTKNVFIKDSLMSALLTPEDYTSGKMEIDKTGKLWMFSKNNISYIKNDDLTNNPEITNIPIPSNLRAGVLGFENIQHIKNETYVLGTTNGYLTLDLSKTDYQYDYNVYLNRVTIKNIDEQTRALSISEKGEFDHKKGIVTFQYSVPQYDKYLDITYQYKLMGHIDNWSDWTNKSSVQFENLSFGDYTFEVRAKVGNQISQNSNPYNFKINRPWYISDFAIAIYVLALIGIGFLVHKAYKFYYVRILKHEQIKNEKTIIQIKNEKLNQDIESKNRELVISTMSIIKKNELLNKIKKELKKSNTKKDLGDAISLIDTNLNNTKDWKFFKQAFNNADKDFLDKIKAQHPDLTPNDLRFCAYLRLNLSSKEIAPLLNISTKSVETKRYRLRKRLNLNHDDSLVNYILKF
ncbi:triple tyrosine motif-containing protein [Psychroserpens sp. Hel_I_66]|uniref:helix-turn-helix and ligand-binding sensor domain-containing protein n=1 Tax=Psychroserpens sp. Hel_I_66 TaxID=1250004 RepID=UPI000646B820|nr:triple tyrosine motif-containing protein [Psychroserpens sp. Hel_I_66]